MSLTIYPVRLDMDYEKVANLGSGDSTQAVRNWIVGFFLHSGIVHIERVRLIYGSCAIEPHAIE